MKIELKNVSFSERLSDETNAFPADVYVDGKKCGYCKNDGRGGSTDVHSYPKTRELFVECETYCNNLPDHVWMWDNEQHSMKNNIEVVVDELFQQWLEEKTVTKMKKFDLTHVRWGVPNGHSYKSVNFKKPINTIPHSVLQGYLDTWRSQFKTGEVFLNTNLEGFNL